MFYMTVINKQQNGPESGFALVLALIACMILIALGALIITLSVGDIKTSSQILGQQRAMIAAEKGVNRLLQQYNFDNIPNATQTTQVDFPDDYAADPNSLWTISIPIATGTIHPAGFSMDWQLSTYDVVVTGSHLKYPGTSVAIGVGIGHLGDASLIYK